MPNSVGQVAYTAYGRLIDPTTGQTGATVTIAAGSSIEYSPADLDATGLVGSSSTLCIRSYSLVRVPAGTGQIVETLQPLLIGAPTMKGPADHEPRTRTTKRKRQ